MKDMTLQIRNGTTSTGHSVKFNKVQEISIPDLIGRTPLMRVFSSKEFYVTL